MTDNTRAEKARNLRYKRPALASMGYDAMRSELYEIQEACCDVRWYMEQGDETLLNALGDDEEAEWEFRMAFADLDAKAEQLADLVDEWVVQDEYDNCTVALIGNRYDCVGFDTVEEDYFSLTRYEAELGTTEAGKRLMRLTKKEMISTIGQCLGVLIAFLDLRQQYDYLKASIDIIRGENTSLLKQIKEVEAAYEEANEAGFRPWEPATRRFDRLIEAFPERMWIE